MDLNMKKCWQCRIWAVINCSTCRG